MALALGGWLGGGNSGMARSHLHGTFRRDDARRPLHHPLQDGRAPPPPAPPLIRAQSAYGQQPADHLAAELQQSLRPHSSRQRPLYSGSKL